MPPIQLADAEDCKNKKRGEDFFSAVCCAAEKKEHTGNIQKCLFIYFSSWALSVRSWWILDGAVTLVFFILSIRSMLKSCCYTIIRFVADWRRSGKIYLIFDFSKFSGAYLWLIFSPLLFSLSRDKESIRENQERPWNIPYLNRLKRHHRLAFHWSLFSSRLENWFS